MNLTPLIHHLTSSDDFKQNLLYYKSKHRTVGCKVTHMIGVPMIVASLLFLPFSRRRFVELQVCGWILQFIGHFIYERNRPVILEVRDPLLLASALTFAAEEWASFLSGREL